MADAISKAESGGNVQETSESLKDAPPAFEYDRLAERKLRNKIDLMIMPTTCLLYLFCFIDRANIGNARIAGMDVDLNMQGFDYNATLSVFYVSYIVFELPSNVLCKIVGPGWFIPFLTVMFGICSVGCGFVTTTEQMMGVRFLLGIFEAGMMPGVAYYLSRWYRRSELTFRMGLYLVTGPVAGAFGAMLAGAILNLDSFGAAKGWRMIFAIEGVITIGLGVVGFFTLTDRPETATWLSDEEKRLCEERIRSERPGQTKVLDKMDVKKLKLGMLNPVTISTSFIFLFCNITVQGLGFFLPTIVRSIYSEKTVIQQQLFTVPPYIVGSVITLVIPLLSWRWDRRQIFMIISAPMGITGYIMFLATADQTTRYAATFLIASSAFYLGALTNGQVSANVVSDTARSSAIGLNVLLGNIGGVCGTLIVASVMLLWMKRSNKQRERDEAAEMERIRGLSQEEQEDLDWKHPSFRWRP